MHAFNQSLKYDQRMHAADIRGSIAYAKALTLVGILTEAEEAKISNGLRLVGREWEDGVVWRVIYKPPQTLNFTVVHNTTRRRRYSYSQRTPIERTDWASGW